MPSRILRFSPSHVFFSLDLQEETFLRTIPMTWKTRCKGAGFPWSLVQEPWKLHVFCTCSQKQKTSQGLEAHGPLSSKSCLSGLTLGKCWKMVVPELLRLEFYDWERVSFKTGRCQNHPTFGILWFSMGKQRVYTQMLMMRINLPESCCQQLRWITLVTWNPHVLW